VQILGLPPTSLEQLSDRGEQGSRGTQVGGEHLRGDDFHVVALDAESR
jgi:hypothetical protein